MSIAFVSSYLLDDITDAADSMQKAVFRVVVQFFAQAFDIYVNKICSRVKVVVPHFFQNGHPSANPAGGAHQEFEQAVLAGGQLDFSFAATGFVSDRVERKVANSQQDSFW